MNNKLLTWLLTAWMSGLFLVSGLHAGTEVNDIIIMDYTKYEKRRFKLPRSEFVKFTHKKHNIDYEISCEECHHHLDLELGDDVKQCVECHIELKVTKKNRKSMLLHRNAMHSSCIECHKDFNKKAGDPRGAKESAPPTSCSECHVRTDVKQKK